MPPESLLSLQWELRSLTLTCTVKEVGAMPPDTPGLPILTWTGRDVEPTPANPHLSNRGK